VIKRAKFLGPITVLRGTDPGGNSRHWSNQKIDTGKESFRPTRLGCTEGWVKTGGVEGVPPVDKV